MQTKHAVQRILWQILILNILVAIGKIVVGVLTGAIALIADGVHSSFDGASNVIALIAQRIASQPPDDDHPYGHERFETVATLAIGGLLLLTAWELLQVGVGRLLSGGEPTLHPAQFVVLVATLAINIFVAIYERRAAQRYHSQLLEADAAHTGSDVWVSLSVLASLIGVWLGWTWLDAAVALLIVGVIVRVAWQIVQRTTTVLVDAAPLPAEALEKAISGTPGVIKIVRARSRGSQEAIHVDLDVEVEPVINAEATNLISDTLRERIQEAFPAISEVRIQVTPNSNSLPDVLTLARGAADMLGLGVHEVIGVTTPRGKVIEMHVEVPAGVTLKEAHQLIESLERRLVDLPEIVEVLTHIEPAAKGTILPATSPEATRLHDAALEDLTTHFTQGHWHHSSIRRDGYGGYAFTTHCHLPGEISIETAHQLAEEAEIHLRMRFPQLHRVTIHTEPEGA